MGSWQISKAQLKSFLSARNHQAVALTCYLQNSKTKAVALIYLIHNIKTKAVALICLLKISRIKTVVLICFVKKSKTKVVALTCLIQNILTKKMHENHQKEVISTVTRIQSFNDLACDQFTYIYYLTFCLMYNNKYHTYTLFSFTTFISIYSISSLFASFIHTFIYYLILDLTLFISLTLVF